MASWIALLALLLVHEATSFNLHSGWTVETAAGPDRLVALHIFVKHAPGATESLRHRLHGNSDPFSPTTYAEKRGRERENVCARAREGLFMCPYSLALPCTNQYCIPRTLSCTMYAHTHTRHIVRPPPPSPFFSQVRQPHVLRRIQQSHASASGIHTSRAGLARQRRRHGGSQQPGRWVRLPGARVGAWGEGRGAHPHLCALKVPKRGARCPPTSVCIGTALFSSCLYTSEHLSSSLFTSHTMVPVSH